MFPHEQESAQNGLWRRSSLPPPRLPRLYSHPGSLGGSIGFQNQSGDDSRHHRDPVTPTEAKPERQHFRSQHERPRGRSFEQEGVYLRTMLPSVASLMPPPQQVQELRAQHESSFNSTGVRQQQHRQPSGVTEFLRDSRPHGYIGASSSYPVASAGSPTAASSLRIRRGLVPAPLTGLSAFADPQPMGMRSSRYAATPNNRPSRWSPYASARGISSDPIAIPWDDAEDERAQRNHRRRRTSPRRRLAASKARAHALHMRMEGEQVGLLHVDRFESDHRGYRLHERNCETTPPLFVPQPSITLRELSLPMPLRPLSPILVDESDTSPNTKSSRYLREMDRRTILARLDRGEKQSALAKEFRVTRAAICNLNKHRDHVLSRQHEDPLAKHPKKARCKQEPEDETESEDAAPSLRHGSNRVSLHLSDASRRDHRDSRQSMVHAVALQPAERLIPLLLSSETSDTAFRRYCDCLMTLVIEEVLAWTHTEVNSNTQAPVKPLMSCGVAIAPGGSPMLSIFQTLEPELPTRHVKLNLGQNGSPVAEILDLPPAVASHNVCLFYAFTDAAGGVRVAKSIRELLDRGAVEELLCLVTLAVSAFTVGELQRAHPNLRIAAAHVETQQNADALYKKLNRQTVASDQNSRLELLASRAAEIY